MLKPKKYHFVSEWSVDAERSVVVHAVMDVTSWYKWWPGLVRSDIIEVVHGPHGYKGSKFAAIWRSSSGYKLHIRILITHYRASEFFGFDSSGDLVGKGSWTFTDAPGGTRMYIIWEVATTKAWMNILGPLLRPIFVYNHKSIMRKGEAGLRKFLMEK